MYEDTINDLVRRLADADRKEAARIHMRIQEIKAMQQEHAPT